MRHRVDSGNSNELDLFEKSEEPLVKCYVWNVYFLDIQF